MNEEQMRAEFEAWWANFQSEHEEWKYADREALLFQAWQAALQANSVPNEEQTLKDWLAWQAALQAKSVPVARSLDFEAMHTPFGIHATPQQADKVRDLEAKMIEALTELCDEIDRHEIHTAISETSISWFKRRAREALAALKGE